MDALPCGTSAVSVVRALCHSGMGRTEFCSEFSPDGALLATSGSDNDVTLWDVSDPAAPKLVQTLPGHTSRSWYVAFSNDGSQLASASADATVQIWDLSGAAKPQLIDRLVGHDKWVRGVAFSADGNTLYTAGDDQTLRTWSLRDDRPGPTAYVWTVDIATERSLLAAAGFDGHLYLWDIGDPAAPQPVAVRWGQEPAFTIWNSARTSASSPPEPTMEKWSCGIFLIPPIRC